MITVIFILLGIIVLLAVCLIGEKTSSKTTVTYKSKTNTNKDSDSEIIKYTDMEKSLKIKTIKNNIITTINNEISCVVKVSTPDYNIMNEADQNLYENKLMDLIFKLNHDIKIITIVRNAETKQTIKNIQQSRNNLKDNQKLLDYSNNLEEALKKEKNTKVFQKYYCIFSREKDPEEQLKDLKHKAAVFINSVENTGSSAKILTTDELIELLNVILKKYETIDIEELQEKGIFDICR